MRKAHFLAILLFSGCWLAYVANCRVIATNDSLGTSLVPFAIWQDGTLRLDRYVGKSYPESAYCFYRGPDGHWQNIYPVGASLVAAPLYWPLLFVSELDPSVPHLTISRARRAEKYAAATLAALAVALLFDLLRRMTTLGRSAGLSALFGLATPMFTVGSQALFQHGPAALTLISSLRLLLVGSPGPFAASSAGVLAALLVAIRPTNLPFALLLALVASRHGRRVMIPFAVSALAGGVALLAYNLSTFDSPFGGYARFDPAPGFDFRWSALAGLVASPRGLLFFCPFLPLLFWRWRRPALLRRSEVVGAGLAVAASMLIHAGQWSWWGGENFGARFWIDGLPLVFLVGAGAFDGARSIGRKVCWMACGSFALFLQVVGAFTFPKGETGYASDLETATWSLDRSPVRLAFSSGLAPAELWPLTALGPKAPLPPAAAWAQLRLVRPPRFWSREGLRTIELELRNLGTSSWSGLGGSFGRHAVRLHSWWRKEGGTYYRDSSVSIGGALDSGERRTLHVELLGPREVGIYDWQVSIVETQLGGYRLFDGPESTVSLRVRVVEPEEDIARLEAAADRPVVFQDGFESGSTARWATAPAR